MIFIHAADLHLGSQLRGLESKGLPSDIREVPMTAFSAIADLCENKSSELLLLAGDVFDGVADLATLREATRIIERITNNGTRVVAIRGNHDAASRVQAHIPHGIENYWELSCTEPETVLLDDIGVAVHGRGFEAQHVSENIVQSYPAAQPDMLNIGLLHTSLDDEGKHARYAPCVVDDLRSLNYDYWALGHIHQRIVHSENPWIIHAGNPQGRDIGELGARGVTVVEFENGGIVGEPQHVNVDSLRWHHLTVELQNDESVEDLLSRIEGEYERIHRANPEMRHVIRTVVTGRGAAHHAVSGSGSTFESDLHSAALQVSGELFLEKIINETSPNLPPISELIAREDFVGDLARSIAVDGGSESDNASDPNDTSGVDVDLSALNKRLRGVAPEALVDINTGAIQAEEFLAARNDLIDRLLLAHSEHEEKLR